MGRHFIERVRIERLFTQIKGGFASLSTCFKIEGEKRQNKKEEGGAREKKKEQGPENREWPFGFRLFLVSSLRSERVLQRILYGVVGSTHGRKIEKG